MWRRVSREELYPATRKYSLSKKALHMKKMFLPSNDVPSRIRLLEYCIPRRHLRHNFDRKHCMKNNSHKYKKKSIVLNSCKFLEMQFEYNVCGKLLNSKPRLQRHRRIHNGKNSFKYNKCGRAFRMLWKLNKHKKTHPERKVYQCAECGKAYRQKTNLVQHQKINAKEKPFKCEACGKPSPGCHLTVIIRKSTMKRKPMSAMYVASLSNKTQPSVNIKTFTKRSCTDVRTV